MIPQLGVPLPASLPSSYRGSVLWDVEELDDRDGDDDDDEDADLTAGALSFEPDSFTTTRKTRFEEISRLPLDVPE